MRRIVLPALVLALPLVGWAAPQAHKPQAPAVEQPSPFPYELRVDHLPNGLTVVRVPFPSPGLISYVTVVRVGSRNEVEPGRTGYAHFFEHMMFRGTLRYPENARDRFIERNGFEDNAFTTLDFTLYHSTGPSSALEQLVDVEADRFEHLSYSEPAFRTEAKAVLGEYNKDAASPDLKLEEQLASTAFKQHPYRHTTLGFLRDIQDMPNGYTYSQEFFKRWYTPDNTLIYVAGDFDDGKLMHWIRAKYGPWQGKASQLAIPKEPPQGEQRTAQVTWPEQTLPRLYNLWHTPAASLENLDTAVLNVLGAYLAGPTSPLYKTLVLQKQWAESVADQTSEHRDPNLLAVSVTLKDPSHIKDAQHAINGAVKDLVTGKLDRPRLEAIKSNIRYGLLMGLETPEAVATQLAIDAAEFGAPDALPREMEAIAKVKPEQLQAFAKRYLAVKNRSVVTLVSSSATHPQSAPGAHR